MEEISDLATYFGEIQNRGIAIFSDRFIYASPSFCKATGWDTASLQQKALEEIMRSPGITMQKSQKILLRHASQETDHPAELVFLDPPRLGIVILNDQSTASRFLDSQALHDIRNPLNTILGYGRIFHDDTQLPSRSRQAADAIVQAAEQIRTKLGGPSKASSPISIPADSGEKTPGRKIKILIVDDDPDNRTVLGLFLKKHPLTLLYANNGASAYEIASREHPDLIFMDLHMPNMNGKESAEKIKKSFPQIKIVALTADMLAVEEPSPQTQVFERRLHKPFDRREIRDAIAELTGLHLHAKRTEKHFPLPESNRIAPSRIHEILTFTKAGHITELEVLIEGCKETEVKAYLSERLAHFDLEGIIRWAENGLNHGQ